jgi:hypothetical protein
MKITQTWVRNMPSTVSGESITIKTTYSSFRKEEIDELEKKMPKGTIIANTNKEQSNQNENI